jgi:hypothetical protein
MAEESEDKEKVIEWRTAVCSQNSGSEIALQWAMRRVRLQTGSELCEEVSFRPDVFIRA